MRQSGDKQRFDKARSSLLNRQSSAAVARWLSGLRLLGAAFQVAGLGYCVLALDFVAPVAPIAVALGISVATTLALYRASRLQQTISSWVIALLLAQDIVCGNVVLSTLGGIDNPFASLPGVYVALAAALLPSPLMMAVVMTGWAGYAFLLIAHPRLEAYALGWHLPWPFAFGRFLAFVLSSYFSAYCVRIIAARLERKRAAIASFRHREAETERVISLATLAATAAHGLASPLTSIAVVARDLETKAGAWLLQQKSEAQGENALTRVREDAQLICREVARCRSALQQMAQRANAPEEDVGETAIVADIVREAIAPLFCRSHIEAMVDASAHLVVLTHRHHVVHTLRALVDNAVEAVNDVPLPQRCVRVHVEAKGQRVIFVVRDVGPGMPSAVMEQLFRPGFSTKQQSGGMGLGLFLAKAIADQLGGSLSFESTAGIGTIATLELPMLARRKLHKDYANEGTLCLVSFDRTSDRIG